MTARRPQSTVLTVVKGSALSLALFLWLLVGARLAQLLLTPSALIFALPGIVLGYLAADLLSGTVHWFCDTFFAEDSPLIGRTLIAPFRDHHRHPTSITDYSLLEQDGSSAFIVIVPLWLLLRRGGPDPAAGLEVLVCCALWAFALGALATNLFHKWAHAQQAPAWVRWLQRHRLILSVDAHAVHHNSYTGGYCVTSGWLNAALDRIGFFARLERSIRWLIRRPRPVANGQE